MTLDRSLDDRSREVAADRDWGMVPALTATSGTGLLMVALAGSLATAGAGLAEAVYVAGYVLIAVPIGLRLVSGAPVARERLVLVVLLGVALYLARLLRSPTGFTGYDELQHLRTLGEILASGRLFEANPLLTVSPYYPGLEVLTAAVVQLSGTEAFAAASVALGVVRLLFCVGLFALYREASSSARVAGLAAAAYMLNPSFAFFNGQFAYETLALPFVPVLLLTVALLAHPGRTRGWLWLALFVVIATIVMTHHLTSFIATGLLAVWLAIRLIRGQRDTSRILPVAVAFGVMSLASATWLLVVAPVTLRYLGGPMTAAVAEFLRLILDGEGRPLFQSGTGAVSAVWERVAGLGLAALLMAALPVGLIALWTRLRSRSLALLLGVLALGYPLSLVGRLMPTGSEAAGRSLAVVYLGLSFLVALAVVHLLEGPLVRSGPLAQLSAAARRVARRAPARAWQGAFGLAVALMAVGAIVLGTAPATRLPGPYIVGADSRSIDEQSTQAARWVRATLGPERRFAADRVNRLLLGAYGEVDVVFHGATGVETWQVFLSADVGETEIARLRQAGIRYILIDRRLSTGLPLVRFYYEEGEIFSGPHRAPLRPEVLGKWDAILGVARIFDSGHIQIYDVGKIVDG